MGANSGGQPGFVFANQALDRVMVESGPAATPFVQGRQDGVLSPNAVQLADLNGDGLHDLIVANGGGNDVLVYLGLADGQFGAAQRYYVGTDPTGLTTTDLNGDGLPDLVVANKGSNDVSLLFGQGQSNNWNLLPGPRLQAGVGDRALRRLLGRHRRADHLRRLAGGDECHLRRYRPAGALAAVEECKTATGVRRCCGRWCALGTIQVPRHRHTIELGASPWSQNHGRSNRHLPRLILSSSARGGQQLGLSSVEPIGITVQVIF
jgi:hypothetical protein